MVGEENDYDWACLTDTERFRHRIFTICVLHSSRGTAGEGSHGFCEDAIGVGRRFPPGVCGPTKVLEQSPQHDISAV